MSSTTAHHTVEVLRDIFATHGYPRLLVSDNVPQLTADYLESYLHSHHILHHKSSPYHPATNGLAENMVKNVKQWLKKQEGKMTFNTMLAIFYAPTEMLHTLSQVDHQQK